MCIIADLIPKKRSTQKVPHVLSAPADEGGVIADSVTVSESLAGHGVAPRVNHYQESS